MHNSGDDQARPLDLSPEEIAKLQTSAERFATLTNLSPDVVSIIGADGQLLFNSPAALRIHGYSNAEMVGRNTMDFIHPDDRERVANGMTELAAQADNHVSVQYRYRHKDGHYTWMEAHGYNQLDNPLIQGFITISRDISERKKAEEDLRSALAVRDEFLSIASHELKTPLTFLKAQLGLLERKFLPGSKVEAKDDYFARALHVSLQQVDRLVNLVNDLLDSARIREGKLLLDLRESDLSAAVASSIDHFQTQLGTTHKLTGKIESGVRGVWDLDRITQVVVNLIGNAVKHAPGSAIEVSLARTGTKVTLKVSDRGPGISPGYLPMIFERFELAGNPRDSSGLGLGLFIAKRIVDAHQGKIWVESELGKGATFFVELPSDLPLGITLPLTWQP